MGKYLAVTVIVGLLMLCGGVAFEANLWFQRQRLLSSLLLADDASSPDAKAKYLRQFKVDVLDADLGEYAAWINRTERTSIKAQLDIIDTLIQRCDETAALPRESFGFAQGMTQITGQEFDHTMSQVYVLFGRSVRIGYGIIATMLAWLAIFVGGLALAGGIFVWCLEASM